MNAAEMRRLTEDELQAAVARLKREQLNLRFRQAEGMTEGLGRMRAARREAARAKTILAEKRRAAAPS